MENKKIKRARGTTNLFKGLVKTGFESEQGP